MFQLIAIAFCGLASVILLNSLNRYRVRMSKLNTIPTVGRDGFFSSYVSAYKFLKNAEAVVQEGYNRYPNSAFKVPLLDQWAVLVSGPDMINDLRRATDDQMSSSVALEKFLHMHRVFGKSFHDDPYHLGVIQTTLTRSIGSKTTEVYEEIVAAFNDLIPPTKDNLSTDWIQATALDKVLDIVVRASNRLYVGLPLCRNPEWMALNTCFATGVFGAAQTTNLFPTFLQPIVHWWVSPRSKAFATASKILRPTIIERLERLKIGEEGTESSDDLLGWLIKATNGKKERLNPDDLILRMLFFNMASIHTTALTHALFQLAPRPELVKLLRDEVEPVIQADGWTKAAMGKLRMMDSFLKETQRVSSSPPLSVQRVNLHDFTFSNGVVVPAGTFIVVCARATHFDQAHYPSSSQFDALRSYRKREKENESNKHQMVTPEVDYLTFGTGRFFAVNELKLILSHILLHYDIKFEEGKKQHQPVMFGGRVNPDPNTQVMFRKRAM
ncbi:hypothetical protein VNI00_002288 [Paramarasmius palmivorus]|uniref:Cytochrome P450 n=1 Tax=Paramarasmius palmivorus TaxID=297713 RepID=A0AAW0E474_9AGAR